MRAKLLVEALAALSVTLSLTDLANATPTVPPAYSVALYATGVYAAQQMAVGPDGRVYVADYGNEYGNNLGRVIAINSDGSLDVLASGFFNLNGLAFTASGRMFVSSAYGTVFEIVGGASIPYATGFLNSTSIAAVGEELFVSDQSGISKIAADGSVSSVLTWPAVYGLSFDGAGRLHFITNSTGQAYSYDFVSIPHLDGQVSAQGGVFSGMGHSGSTCYSDIIAAALYCGDANGESVVFASGFIGTLAPPQIGPTGIAYDGGENLYVGDGNFIWRITRPTMVGEPSTLALLVLGLAGVGFARRREVG